MQTVTLGKTGITVDKNGFGALPIQRVAMEEAKTILRRAFDGGIRFFDTARVYSDSEEKLGAALSDVRSQIYISTKSQALTAEGFNQHRLCGYHPVPQSALLPPPRRGGRPV